MATVKMLGMYTGLPTYGMRSLLIWVCFGLPFLPIFQFASNPDNEVPVQLLPIYFPLYLIQTFLLGKYISRIGRQWSLKEYNQLKTDQVTFPFIFALGMHSFFHFILFASINEIVYYINH